MKQWTHARTALLLGVAAAALLAAPALAQTPSPTTPAQQAAVDALTTMLTGVAPAAPLGGVLTGLPLRVSEMYKRTGCLRHAAPGHACPAASPVAWFSAITTKCNESLAALALDPRTPHMGCAKVNAFKCYGAQTCGNRSLVDDNTTLEFGYDYVRWQVSDEPVADVVYDFLATPHENMTARAQEIRNSAVNGVSMGEFADGLVVNWTEQHALPAHTARMGFSYNRTLAAGAVVTRYLTNRKATEQVCLEHMDTTPNMRGMRLFSQITTLCGSFVKKEIYTELERFELTVLTLSIMCGLSPEKESTKTLACLAKSDVPALGDLALKAGAPGGGYCTDKGVHEHLRCMPKCACKGGAQYQDHVDGFTILGNGVFPGLAPCFDATSTFDSMCGEHREGSGLAPGGIAAIVVVVVVLVAGGVVGVVYVMQLRARAAEEAAGAQSTPTEQQTLVGNGGSAYMGQSRYHDLEYHAHPAHGQHHAHPAHSQHHAHPAHSQHPAHSAHRMM